MRHDYDLPDEWPEMTSEEKHLWMVGERARRQALAQDTETSILLYRAGQEDYR